MRESRDRKREWGAEMLRDTEREWRERGRKSTKQKARRQEVRVEVEAGGKRNKINNIKGLSTALPMIIHHL